MSVAAPEALAVFDAYLAIQASRYAHLSAGVIILYDHVITLDQEVSLVWQEPLSLGKILFLSNRYCAFFTTMFDFYAVMSPPNLKSFCTQVYRWQGWTSIVITILAQAILQLRIYALYSKNKRILIAMSILFIVSVSASALITSEILSRLTGVLYPIPPLGQFCLQNRVKLRIYYTFWIPAMAFDVFLSVLTISKSFKLRKSLATSVFCQTGEKLVDVFFRDSAIYFVVITATYITCMLVWIIGASDLTELPLGFAVAFPCVVSNRMILNLRGIRQRENIQTGNNPSAVNYGTSSSFGFALQNQVDTYLS